MRILYAPAFLRQLKHLPPDLREQALAAIEAFQNRENHVHLKVHKLKGRLAGQYAFSVNFHYRITFEYLSSETVWFLDVGDHGVYR